MKMLELVRRESDISTRRILVAATLAGIALGTEMLMLNRAGQRIDDKQFETQLLVVYTIALIVYFMCQRYALAETARAIEAALQRVKMRIARQVRCVELRFVEVAVGYSAFSALTQDTSLIAQSAITLTYVVLTTGMLLVCGLSFALAAPAASGLTLLCLGVAIPLLMTGYRRAVDEQKLAANKDAAFFDCFDQMLRGFKEVKLDPRRSDALFENMKDLTRASFYTKNQANQLTTDNLLLANSIFLVLLPVVVFILPELLPAGAQGLHKTVSTILFIMGPVTMYATAIPLVARTDAAVANLYALERKLGASIAQESVGDPADLVKEPIEQFSRLSLKDLCFSYRDREGKELFVSGPHNLELLRGETVFIVGGNGSGKSTLLKLLCGLYFPTRGMISVDDMPIAGSGYHAYRQLFGVVFADFHLFDQVYGVPANAGGEVARWIKTMELENKTGFQDRRFTDTDLSTGQRKRLAFITTVVAKRPIYIFDELAADQDPQFRDRFYREILPGLKRGGSTLIIVTHDDQYFGCADRVITMDAGHIVSDTRIRPMAH